MNELKSFVNEPDRPHKNRSVVYRKSVSINNSHLSSESKGLRLIRCSNGEEMTRVADSNDLLRSISLQMFLIKFSLYRMPMFH